MSDLGINFGDLKKEENYTIRNPDDGEYLIEFCIDQKNFCLLSIRKQDDLNNDLVRELMNDQNFFENVMFFPDTMDKIEVLNHFTNIFGYLNTL